MNDYPAPSGLERISRLAFVLLGGAVVVLVYRAFLVLPQFRVFGLTLVSLSLEALPYLLLGAAAATLVGEALPAGRLAALAPKLGLAGVPIAALAGIAAPVCECAIVPTVARLREKGLALPYVMTLLVAVPLVNPVVLLSTLAAFPGRPELVIARFAGGYLVAVGVGLFFWIRERMGGGTDEAPRDDAEPVHHHHHVAYAPGTGGTSRLVRLARGTLVEFLEVSRYFVVGAALASLVQVVVPAGWFAELGSSLAAATAVMIALAFLLSVCSEADAFIGKAFLPLVPAPAVVAFLVFGPMLDLKNTAMLSRVVSAQTIVRLALVLLLLVGTLTAVLGVIW